MTEQANINTVLDPELADSQQQLKQDIFRTMNCVKIGQIQIFDQRVLNDGSTADYPVLVDCPVFTPQGGGGALQFPIAPGDQCILLFSDRNIDAWFKNGSAAEPFDARCHDLSDGIALVGLNSLASNLANYQANVAKIFYDGARVSLAGGLVTIGNQSTTLLTLLNLFITLLEGITVQDGSSTLPLTTASIAAIEAFKLQFASLLQ